ncbi:hypothetical protein EVAR_68626_1 [Eumeta japonica]|uniref:Uncharacterized protein n=1 Tax=Eumeta variegata TaxID=151549 RepID=A0A4C2A9H8_EUMVA|nr:hypothetical protein EVAR_68626_1 [Eumeta japonica]
MMDKKKKQELSRDARQMKNGGGEERDDIRKRHTVCCHDSRAKRRFTSKIALTADPELSFRRSLDRAYIHVYKLMYVQWLTKNNFSLEGHYVQFHKSNLHGRKADTSLGLTTVANRIIKPTAQYLERRVKMVT